MLKDHYRDFNDVIMTVLEAKGLDKRFRDNPEAINQICSLVSQEISQKTGQNLDSLGASEVENMTTRLLDMNNTVESGEIRKDNFYSIDQDGSLSVKLKTNSTEQGKTDTEKKFSIGEPNGGLVVSEITNCLRQGLYEDCTQAIAGVNFQVFNSHGLETNRRTISESVSLNTRANIKTVSEAFGSIANSGVKYHIEPLTETSLTRRPDLATLDYFNVESVGGDLLAFNESRIRNSFCRNDSTGYIPPICYSTLGGMAKPAKTQTLPTPPPEYHPNYLYYREDEADWYENATPSEKTSAINRAYRLLAENSNSFRETLSDAAKNDVKLQNIIKDLDLVQTSTESDKTLMRSFGIVTNADFKRFYDGSSGELKDALIALKDRMNAPDKADKGITK